MVKNIGSLLFCLFLLASCYSFGAREDMAAGEEGYYEYLEEAPVSKRVAAPAAVDRDVVSALSAAAPPSEPPREQEPRKRVYSGYCRLRVNEAEETKRRIADITEESGGYVEAVYATSVVIRVPAEHFEEIFRRLLDLGEVDAKTIETYDVTEYFRDQDTRLRLHERTRERLYALLEKTTDVEERLAILREIKRLTEEIERINRTLELLERQIAFSRITVELMPRLPPTSMDRSTIPFRWIAGLDPLYPRLRAPKGRISLSLGADFAVFEKDAAFRAESAEGTRIRVGAADNDPRGDAVFWRTALAYHLGPFYRSAEPVDLGSLQGVLFTSKDTAPFSYLVGVLAVEPAPEEIVVVEVFFPDREALQNRLRDIEEAIVEMEVR